MYRITGLLGRVRNLTSWHRPAPISPQLFVIRIVQLICGFLKMQYRNHLHHAGKTIIKISNCQKQATVLLAILSNWR
jgi:hypothetical protein